MKLLGVEWLGVNAESGRKLLFSLLFVAVVLGMGALLRGLAGLVMSRTDHATVRAKFWTRQAVSLLSAALLILGLMSIWFDDPTRLATAFGLVSAGLAFALQQVITSIAGYFVILRGKTFNVGDRISMGGVRGDVLQLGFIQTTIMEMGQPPSVQGDDPAVWVRSRQFTGRIVTVSNSKIFAEPVYNYTRDFPFIWEEMVIPITYQADRTHGWSRSCWTPPTCHALERRQHRGGEAKDRPCSARFGVEPLDLVPRVFFRITDNWLELTVRFVLYTHQIRTAKDAMSRHIISGTGCKAGIGIASATYDIVGLPPIEVRMSPDARPAEA